MVLGRHFGMALKPALELPARKDAALFLVLFEGGVEALPVHRQPALQGELFGEFEGEAVGIVEAERLLAADDRFFNVGRVLLRHEGVLALEPLHALFKFLDSLREGGFEAVCLVLDLGEDILLLLVQVGVCLAVHFVDEDGGARQKGARLHAELAAVADGAAHDAA